MVWYNLGNSAGPMPTNTTKLTWLPAPNEKTANLRIELSNLGISWISISLSLPYRVQPKAKAKEEPKAQGLQDFLNGKVGKVSSVFPLIQRQN